MFHTFFDSWGWRSFSKICCLLWEFVGMNGTKYYLSAGWGGGLFVFCMRWEQRHVGQTAYMGKLLHFKIIKCVSNINFIFKNNLILTRCFTVWSLSKYQESVATRMKIVENHCGISSVYNFRHFSLSKCDEIPKRFMVVVRPDKQKLHCSPCYQFPGYKLCEGGLSACFFLCSGAFHHI